MITRTSVRTSSPRRPRRGSRPTLRIALVTLSLVAASCGGGGSNGTTATSGDFSDLATAITQPDSGPPRSGGRIVFALEAETNSWDPTGAQWSASSGAAISSIFDHLAAFDEDGLPQPYLAESIEPNPDATEWTIRVRDHVVFHDDTAMDAAAVKLNLDRQKTSPLVGQVLAPIQSIEVVDRLTVRVTMSTAWATFPSVLAGQPGVVAAPTQLESPEASRRPIGTGPFVFRTWSPDSSLLLTRNPNYWRPGLPYADEVEFRILTESETRRAALDSGAIDGFQDTDPSSIQAAREEALSGKTQMFTDAGSDTAEMLLGLNTVTAPFDDLLARQIVATAIDTTTISQVAFFGIFPPANGPFTESSPGYASTGYPAYDPARAKELADQYAQANGAPLEFTLRVGQDFASVSVAELIQAQLLEVGVDMSIEGVEQAAMITKTLLGDYQAMYGRLFGATTFDRETSILSADTARPVGDPSVNFTRVQDGELTTALQKARSTTDPDIRALEYAVVQQRLTAVLPYIFLVHSVTATVYSLSLHGLDNPTLPDGRPMLSRGSPMMYNAWLSRSG